MIAVDASVAVKWLWPEPGHVEAKELLKAGTRLVAPAIIRIEVAGAVLRRYRENQFTEAETHSILALWNRILQSGVLHLVPVDELFDLAVAVSILSRHALADSLYVAVGKDMDVELLTADETMHRRCKSVYPKVHLLTSPVPH